jgi:HD superfamily phosphodiesterase
MKYPRAKITRALAEHFNDDDRRIEHALRVLFHAERIMADYPLCDEEVVIACALLHDVGIKPSEARYGYNDGRTQEELGPPEAERILVSIGCCPSKIDKVKEIIGNHHSPSRYDYPELEVLKKADRIVNQSEKA